MTGSVAALPGSVPLSASRRTPAWLVEFLVGAATCAVGAFIIDGLPVGVTNDDSMYVILAKSLATGQGYRWLNLPGMPVATHFPPGYPAFLALLWWVNPGFPANVVLLKLANAVLTAIAAAATFRLARTRLGLSDAAAAGLAFAGALSIPMLTLSSIVMSEPLFLALVVPALILAERVVDAESRDVRDLVTLAVLAGIATLVRTHGIALIAGVALLLGMRRRFSHAGLFLGINLAMLLPWQLWVTAHSGAVPLPMRGNYESYGSWLAAGLRSNGIALIPRTIARTSAELASMLEQLFSPSVPHVVHLVALIALLALSVIGARMLWRRAPVTAAFLGLYTLIVLLWPFPPTRFMWGIWPLVMLLPVAGVHLVRSWRPARREARAARLSALAAGILLACGYLTYNVRGYRHQWWSSIPRAVSRTASPLISYVATRTPRDALLATEVETAVYLYTGRSTVPVTTFTVDEYFTRRTPAQNAAAMRAIFSQYRPSAVIITSGTMRDAARELAFGTPRLLVAVDTFPAGGLVLTPTSRW